MKPNIKTTKLILVILLLLSSLWLAAMLLAQTSSSYDVSWFTLANGRHQTSDNYILQDAIGQLTGDLSASANTAIQSGFIQAETDTDTIFLPLVVR